MRGERRLSRSKSLSKFWSSYGRSWMGVIGLAILLFFVVMSIAAPLLTPYDPLGDKFLAEGVALPSWYKAFPGYNDFPQTMEFVVFPRIGQNGWRLDSQGPLKLVGEDPLKLSFESASEKSEYSIAELTYDFNYQYAPPLSFQIKTDIRFEALSNSIYEIELLIVSPDSTSFSLWSSGVSTKPVDPSEVSMDTKGLPFEYKSKMGLEWYQNVAEHIFSKKGVYTLMMRFKLKGSSDDPAAFQVNLDRLVLHIPGRVHGILGTDHLGSDLFSQLIFGTRVSLLIGVSAALISVVIGLIVGLISGYLGGVTDEASMRFVDVLLVLPGLPMLMILSGLFGRSIWNIVLLLGLLSWPGFARVVRAQVLQLKTATYVEASKAMGSSVWGIMIRHLLPNVLPLAYATIALYIPGAIITEAALSFLALGDPNTPSWGRIFYSANAFGAFQHLAWWWIIPPGIAITALALSFVFIGTTMDEILNPKVRARR